MKINCKNCERFLGFNQYGFMDCEDKKNFDEIPTECKKYEPIVKDKKDWKLAQVYGIDIPVEEEKEMVNHPNHYNKEGRKECIDEMVDIFGWDAVVSWSIITAYKYQYRCGEKDDVDQEKGKIKWYEKWALNNVAPCMNVTKENIIKYFKAVTK